MFKRKARSKLSQNFLHNRQLVKRLVRSSSIGKTDTVIEVGSGKGIITKELQAIAQQVIAVELDQDLVDYLRKSIAVDNTVLFWANATEFPLPVTEYKVFSNLPFAIEGEMIRKLLLADLPPKETNIVVRKQPALRWMGANKHSQFSVKYKPWFEFSITHEFNPSDFEPQTQVSAVLLQISRRINPLLPLTEKKNYWQFVKVGFGDGRGINHNLNKYISKQKLINVTSKLSKSYKSRPTKLSVNEWVKLYNSINNSK